MRRSGRKRARVDYVALNEAKFRPRDKHHHWDTFLNFVPAPIDTPSPVHTIEATDSFTDANLAALVDTTKLTAPILVKKANKTCSPHNSNVDLSFAFPNVSIETLADLVGPSTSVPVMNSMTQDLLPKWDFHRWATYFASDTRTQILNVISLEVSKTELGSLIQTPAIVREMDIVTTLFADPSMAPLLADLDIECPNVQKYILMSVQGCLTDFHVDFAATSVYYSPIRGRKRFAMFPPLKRNLAIYKRWCLSSTQNETWLPELIPPLRASEVRAILSDPTIPNSYANNGLIVDVSAGDLLLLPAGWIHAVVTLEDSIVYGGNFLNLMSLPSHLEAHQVETDTNVGEKFKFPLFLTLLWLYAHAVMERKDTVYTGFELDCLDALALFFDSQYTLLTNPPLQRSQREAKAQLDAIAKIKASIPRAVVGKDVGAFVERFRAFLDRKRDPATQCLSPDTISPSSSP